jgi:hypothetical protein
MSMQEINATNTKSTDRKSLSEAKSPSDLLLRIRHRFPSETKEQNLQRFIERGLENDDILQDVLSNWHSLNYLRLVGGSHPRKKSSEEKVKQAELAETLKEAAKAALTKIVLLDLIQPNGKPLRDCTGAECAKSGGWLTRIAAMIKPSDIVGKFLSEAQVRELFRKPK